MSRPAPAIDEVSRSFWTGGASGQLLIDHCSACERFQHPPARACATCGGAAEPRPVSGLGTVFTFTVNQQRFRPDLDVPYVVALIELDEQPGLRLPSNVTGCPIDAVHIGMRVSVAFEVAGEAFVPVFVAAGGS